MEGRLSWTLWVGLVQSVVRPYAGLRLSGEEAVPPLDSPGLRAPAPACKTCLASFTVACGSFFPQEMLAAGLFSG